MRKELTVEAGAGGWHKSGRRLGAAVQGGVGRSGGRGRRVGRRGCRRQSLQMMVVPEGGSPGRHDRRDAEVRGLVAALPVRRHLAAALVSASIPGRRVAAAHPRHTRRHSGARNRM